MMFSPSCTSIFFVECNYRHSSFVFTSSNRFVLLERDSSRCTMWLRRSWFISRILECQSQHLVLQLMGHTSALLCWHIMLYTTLTLTSHRNSSLMAVKIFSPLSAGLPRLAIRFQFVMFCLWWRPGWRYITFSFQEEFLLSAPEGLGMFVNAEGMSNRPPIQWSYPLRALAYSHPYILGLSDDVIMVYRYIIKNMEWDLNKLLTWVIN